MVDPLPHQGEEEQAELETSYRDEHKVDGRGVDADIDVGGTIGKVDVVFIHQMLQGKIQHT